MVAITQGWPTPPREPSRARASGLGRSPAGRRPPAPRRTPPPAPPSCYPRPSRSAAGKWDARSARNQCHAFGVVVARNAFTTKITLAGPCVIRPHRNSSSASETACLEFTTQNQDVSVPGHRRHPRGHLRGVVEANCSAQLRIRLASATERLGWMFRVPRGGRRRSTRQCPIFASLPVTSTGRGHGSVAAGVGDGPGGSGLGCADGVSPGRACG